MSLPLPGQMLLSQLHITERLVLMLVTELPLDLSENSRHGTLCEELHILRTCCVDESTQAMVNQLEPLARRWWSAAITCPRKRKLTTR